MNPQVIQEIVKSLKDIEEKRRRIGERIRSLKNDLLKSLILKVTPHPLDDLKAVGVDGSIVSHEYHDLLLIMLRSIAVFFSFKGNLLAECSYYPNSTPDVEVCPVFGFQTNEVNTISSQRRLESEIKTAIEAIDEFKPDIILLDGSIVPQISDKPRKKLIRLYEKLYARCEGDRLSLAGVVEDSRGTRFVNILTNDILPNRFSGNKDQLLKSNDTNILNYVLDAGERTFSFPYSDAPGDHPVLKMLDPEFTKNIYSFYMKTVDLDRPLRIEYLRQNNDDFIASTVFALSMFHSDYGFPSVLIEADERARISKIDLEHFYRILIDEIGDFSSIMRMRREKRPFYRVIK